MSSFSTAGSTAAGPPVKRDLTADVAAVSFWRKRTSLPIEASRKSGRDSMRRVWPVGAVSNTMRSNCANSGAFRNCTTYKGVGGNQAGPGRHTRLTRAAARSHANKWLPPSAAAGAAAAAPLGLKQRKLHHCYRLAHLLAVVTQWKARLMAAAGAAQLPKPTHRLRSMCAHFLPCGCRIRTCVRQPQSNLGFRGRITT
jgi:hypothetical protein